jgi:hypothetical protein
MRAIDIAIDPPSQTGGTGGSGGGTEDDPNFPRIALRSQGLLATAFGFAFGLTFMLFFAIFRVFGASNPQGTMARFVAEINPNLWLSFLYGFISGTVIAVVYNILVMRRLNLFGLESNAD